MLIQEVKDKKELEKELRALKIEREKLYSDSVLYAKIELKLYKS